MLAALRSLWETQKIVSAFPVSGGLPSTLYGVAMGGFVRIDLPGGKSIKMRHDPTSIGALETRLNARIIIV